MKHALTLLALVFVLAAGCSEESTAPSGDVETGAPRITNLSAEKTQILYGGQDPAIISCEASGGNLTYTWEVDLGDIIPLNAARSKVSFNGTACCVGEKVITCTVSNSRGSDSKSIVITILEVVNPPEIIALESDRTEIHSGSGEKAALVCYAIGGNLQYSWSSDCGAVVVDTADPSRASFAATPECHGSRTVTCTVSNEKGSETKTLQLTVVD